MTPPTKTRPPRHAGGASRPAAVVGCAAVGCQHSITRPLLMCMDHWRMVPKAVQRQVWAAYRRLNTDPTAYITHRNAVQAAVEAVRGKQLARNAKRDAHTPDLF